MAENFQRRYAILGAGILLVCPLAWHLSNTLRFSEAPTPSIYLHEDGTVSLNSFHHPRITAKDLKDYLNRFEDIGRLRLVGSDATHLENWEDVLVASIECNVIKYQFDTPQGYWKFRIPTCCEKGKLSGLTHLIDLRKPINDEEEEETQDLDIVNMPYDYNTELWVDRSIDCGTLIKETTLHKNKSACMAVKAEGILLIDESHPYYATSDEYKFRKQHSDFWKTVLIKPLEWLLQFT